MSTIANRGSRAGATAAVCSALALAPVVAHVVEDALAGDLEAFGLAPAAAAWLIGGACAFQGLAALAALRERRGGYVAVLAIAVGWIVTALVEHSDAFFAPEFGSGVASRAAIWGIVLLQGLTTGAASSALRSTRRTSFSGTGSYV